MAGELAQALTAVGITRYCVVGHALGALIGLQLALDTPMRSKRWCASTAG